MRYGSLPIILDGILTQTISTEQDEALKKICDQIKHEEENNFQVFELLDAGNSEKSNKNKLAAFINNKSNFAKVGLKSNFLNNFKLFSSRIRTLVLEFIRKCSTVS